jgi:hypothetical protein
VVAATVVALPLLVWGMYLILRPSDPSKAGTAGGRAPIHVGGAAGGTLDRAVRQARRGDRILLEGDIQEADVWVRANQSGLTIEAAPDKTVVWKCPTNAPANAKLLFIESATNVTLKGITFDGGGKTEALIVLYGKCTGTRLEKLQLRKSTRYGVLFSNCEGDSDNPVALRDLDFLTTPAMTAIRFRNLPGQNITKNRFIALQRCKFEGPGKKLTREKAPDVDDATVQVTPNDPIPAHP